MKRHYLTATNPAEFRKAMGMFATGIAVVTSGHGDEVHAMTANAITSVSLDPPLLLVCVSKDATMAHKIRQNQSFTINILDETQSALSHHFAGLATGEGIPTFEFHDWAGSARLAGCPTALGCSLFALYDGGDHWIAVGQVLAIYHEETRTPPLLFYRGRYHHLARPTAVEIGTQSSIRSTS